MSYKIKILKDHPIGFWQLDDVAVNPSFDFTDILEKFDLEDVDIHNFEDKSEWILNAFLDLKLNHFIKLKI